MRLQLRILIACLLLIFVFLLLIAFLSVPRDPEYQGKRLSAWMNGYDSWNWQIKPATEALRHYGSSAEPTLKQMLRSRDSSIKMKLLKLLSKQPWIKVQITPASVSQYKALDICNLLGTEAKGTVPEIEALVNEYPGKSKNSVNAYFALNTLAVMGPDGIQGLIQALANQDASIRVRAAELLGTAPASDTEEVIAALKKSLNTGDARLQGAASNSLDLIQQRRKQRVPSSATNWVATVESSFKPPFSLWDISQGIHILADSGLEQGQGTLKAEDLFGGRFSGTTTGETGTAIFQDSQPDGFTHFIEWETPSLVNLHAFGLIAGHDAAKFAFQRAFRSFKLYARKDDSEQFTLVYAEDIPIPYGQGPYLGMLFLFRNIESPVQARQFRAEFVQNGSGPWHGPRASELYGFSAPLNPAMVIAALQNQDAYIREEGRKVLIK